MTDPEQQILEPDYRLTRFYTEAEESTVSPYSPIFDELQGLKNRYTKPQGIARGGFKQILRVFDLRTGRNVAMAKLLPDAPSEMYEPFLREARLTAVLEHPYIIAIHDIGVGTDGLPYFTMELKVGDSLGEIIKQLGNGNPDHIARYDRRSLLVIFIKICDAFSYAHSRHVLHLDLKPDNIQVGDFGEVILCDWGLGEIIGSDAETKFDELLLNPDLLNNMTLSGSIRGTLGFMAPEQVDDLKNTERTDIYGLGAILYSILTYAAPIEGNKEEMFEKTRKGEILAPCARFPELEIPQSLAAVVMQAMALAPSGRYSTADELSREVRHYISGFATSAERASAGKLLQLLYRRNRRFFITLGIGLLAVATVVVFSMRELKIKERLASEARERAETALRLYQVEKVHSGTVTSEYMADLIDVNRSFINQDEFVQALAKIERAVVKDPTNQQAWLKKATTHFMMQQFGAAAESYEKAGFKGPNSDLALEYAQAKPDGALLSGAELAELVHRMNQESLRDRMMMYDSSARTDSEEHLLVVKAVLAKLNPEWNAEGFEYDPYSRSLAISGVGLKVLSSGLNTAKCALRTLNLRSLDIHGSSFSNLKNVMVLHVESLDIRQTGVLDIGTVKKMPYLKKLTVSPGRYPTGVLKQLRQKIEVVEED
jgi:serine/threonine-protein kinase